MKLKYWILPASIVMVFACTKDKYGDEAKLVFKNVNKEYLAVGDQEILVELDYLHKTGDIKDMYIHYSKESSSECEAANIVSAPTTFKTHDEMPNIPKGVIEIRLTEINLARNKCDALDSVETAKFKFWFIDKDGFPSDTAETPPITIEKHIQSGND